jgi:hypothetical protein
MVVVDVNDPGLRGHLLRDLVGIARGRQSGPDVEELLDAEIGRQVVHDRRQERAPGVAR